MGPHSLEHTTSVIERLLDHSSGRVALYGHTQLKAGRLCVGLVILRGGKIRATLRVALPLTRSGQRHLERSSQEALSAISSLCLPKNTCGYANFIPVQAPEELPSRAATLRFRHVPQDDRKLARLCKTLTDQAQHLPSYQVELQAAQDELIRSHRPGTHIYVDGSADPEGRLGWSAVLVKEGVIQTILTGRSAGWRQEYGSDGATAAERAAIHLGHQLIRTSGGGILHTDRIDLLAMAAQRQLNVELTPDHNEPMMRLAHEQARSARKNRQLETTPCSQLRGFHDHPQHHRIPAHARRSA